ncbi:HlyD family secretion protein [Methylobacterium sp. BE186]|uniref:HlyD family type I secretion periplasmic adaptor subunit n=1 Tax=Methylobacterium sp. BE186 TaxID=2817715 RepID=UPI00285A02AF|nr:HlyD family type I secretion periplasmic adaptor subunit [Methylobacterium sp. BE186]MDR7035706.1 HlyD family secretion protein [Methylobacterium sp. BE186]
MPTTIPANFPPLSTGERHHRSASPGAAVRHQVRLTALIIAVLVGGVGGWASFTKISGAVITNGQLVVDSDVKKVQHPVGGIVGELRVKEGQRVKAGDILIRLDETQPRSSLDIVLRALDVLAARRAREEAERDGDISIAFPSDLQARVASDPAVAMLLDSETRLFLSRAKARNGQKSQLRERIAQFEQEIAGLTEQVTAKTKEIAAVTMELKGIRELWQKNLVQISRLTNLEREAARLEGDRGKLLAGLAGSRVKINEVELQIMQVDQDMRNEVNKDLTDIRAKWSEYEEKQTAALDLLRRTDLRAPQDGIVHQMTAHTVGGLITPSEPAMLIVPEADELTVEVKIEPKDIDHVRVAQDAILHFTAFSQRTTPEINGKVDRVAADVAQDPKTGVFFYKARIRVPEAERARLGEVQLVPGMPVEAFLQTGERTVLSYLTKPLAEQVAKAWREH